MEAKVDTGPAPRMVRTQHLRQRGVTHRQIAAAVADGRLIRLRRGVFGATDLSTDCVDAARCLGRLTCVSELQRRKVFVLHRPDRLHLHVAPSSSRLPVGVKNHRVHRDELRRTPVPDSLSVEFLDALVHAVCCQEPRAAIASMDSALHHGLLRTDELDELFAALPRRFRRLRRLLDGRAESGPETLLRLILRSIGCAFEVQVRIRRVGRVDFLVDGWLIIECDSEEFHSSWADQRRDRRRDLAAAAQGYATFRPIAEDIMWHPDEVRAAVLGLLALRRSR